MTQAPAARGFDVVAADRGLRRVDPALARWMERIELPERDFTCPFNPVDALARSILYQQLSGQAAATITGRVEALMLRRGYLTAAGLDSASDEALRGAGVSRQKLAALRDLAAKSRAGVVPDHRNLARMGNDDIIRRLTEVRGIGRWTVEILLMFRLGRPDILPHDDLGIRKGVRLVRALDALPKPRETAELGEIWSPWRTRASFYLWKMVGLAEGTAEVRRSQQ